MTAWTDFLTQQGAQWQGDTLVSFIAPEPSQPRGYLLVPLLDHAVVSIQGPDTLKFLQGQLTCDLSQLTEGQHLLGAHCNAKGRMISSFQLAELSGKHQVGMRLRANLAQTALDALNKYMVFSKADGAHSGRLGLALIPTTGQGQPVKLPEATPDSGKFAVHTAYTHLHHSAGTHEFWAEPDQAQALWLSLAPLAQPAPPQAWDSYWLEQGQAEVSAATSEAFIPQMLNYDLLGGVNFKKGCYTGQEIIARLHYRGESKKRTYLATHNQGDNLAIGTEITDGTKPIGTICATARHKVLISANRQSYEAQSAIHPIDQPQLKLAWAEGAYAIP